MKSKSPGVWTIRKEDLSSIIAEMVKMSDPEIIFLLSASYDFRLTENIFIKNPVEELKSSRYHLLVLFDGNQKKSLEKEEIKILNQLNNPGNIQFHLMDIHEFNLQAEAGNEFENFILLNAMLCYDKGLIPLSDPKEYITGWI